MKRVRMTAYVAGTLNGRPVTPGAEFVLPDGAADDFVERGLAEELPLERAVDVEAAVTSAPENAARRTARPKKKVK